MSALPKHRLTPQEYLAIERKAETKSEYYDGELFAMAGASKEHDRIVASLIRHAGNALEGKPCEVFTSDMRITVAATGLYTYADMSIVCGEPEFEDVELDILLNPLVVFEVLSPSTQDYDKGQKFDQYRQLSSLKEYVLIAQNNYHVIHYARGENDEWTLHDIRGLDDRLRLESVGCELDLADIYRNVRLKE